MTKNAEEIMTEKWRSTFALLQATAEFFDNNDTDDENTATLRLFKMSEAYDDYKKAGRLI